MASQKPAAKTASASSKASGTGKAKDAIALLKEDHKRVGDLFDEFEKIAESESKANIARKQEIMDTVCAELTAHALAEEEIFYPAAREALPDEDALLNEAEIEHGSAKDLIAQIEAGDASDPMICARFTVLGEYIDHHVKEEENEMFPKVKQTDLDLVALGEEIAARKEEILETA